MSFFISAFWCKVIFPLRMLSCYDGLSNIDANKNNVFRSCQRRVVFVVKCDARIELEDGRCTPKSLLEPLLLYSGVRRSHSPCTQESVEPLPLCPGVRGVTPSVPWSP